MAAKREERWPEEEERASLRAGLDARVDTNAQGVDVVRRICCSGAGTSPTLTCDKRVLKTKACRTSAEPELVAVTQEPTRDPTWTKRLVCVC